MLSVLKGELHVKEQTAISQVPCRLIISAVETLAFLMFGNKLNMKQYTCQTPGDIIIGKCHLSVTRSYTNEYSNR